VDGSGNGYLKAVRLEEELENRRRSENRGEYEAIRRGWFMGDMELKQELLGLMHERMGGEHYGEE
jgi:hypothetical protein